MHVAQSRVIATFQTPSVFGSSCLTQIAELVFELRQLADSFRDARSNTEKLAFSRWLDLRGTGNLILWEVSFQGFLGSIAGSSTETHLFDALVGFRPDANLILDVFGHNWEIGSGLIEQRNVNTHFASNMIPSVEALWDRYAFDLIGRCVSGCEKIIGVIENELASQKSIIQNDNQTGLSSIKLEEERRLLHKIDRANRSLFWFGESFEAIENNPFEIISILYDAFVKGVQWVSLEDLRNRCQDNHTIKNTDTSKAGIAEVFTVRHIDSLTKKKSRRKMNVWKIIETKGRKSPSYRLIDPREKNPE